MPAKLSFYFHNASHSSNSNLILLPVGFQDSTAEHGFKAICLWATQVDFNEDLCSSMLLGRTVV